MTTLNAITSPAPALVTTVDSTGNLVLQTAGTNAVTYDANQNATHTGSISTPQTFGFKNRIINGAMMVDQRNAGSSVTINGIGIFSLDRWKNRANGSGTYTAQQSTTAPAGFSYSQKYTVATTASSISAGDNYWFIQEIEGYNVADLNWGTANAKPITVSFWVQSSVTGTYSISVSNGTNYNRGYVSTYNITSANTWQYVTITIPGDTTGTWTTSNAGGLTLIFNLGAGSNYQTTANTWAGAFYQATSSTVQWISNSSATFYITGVQVEVGKLATPFDMRDYGNELRMCQRYYFQQGGSAYNRFGGGIAIGRSSTIAMSPAFFPVPMRVFPTITGVNLGSTTLQGTAVSSIATDASETSANYIIGPARVVLTLSGLTTGTSYEWESNNNNTTRLTFSAEI